MWGRGIYFAENAAYSDQGYKYTSSDHTYHKIIVARVLIGDSC